MKLGRIQVDGPDGPVARLVLADPSGGRVVDLARAERLRLERQGASPEAALRLARALFPASMAAAIGAGPLLVEAAARAVEAAGDGAALPLGEVRPLAPLDPPRLRDCMAFEGHIRNSFGRLGSPVPTQIYQLPVYYKGNPGTLIGPDAEVPWPAYSRLMDYELELGFVIGRAGRSLTPQEARPYLFGVTIFNDFSARDAQAREMGGSLGPAKGKDFATAIGPWIATADEVDLESLEMVARVNGEEWSRGSIGQIMWSVEELIAYASSSEPLLPGELIASGTVPLGCGLELGRQLQPGDVVELEVSGVGLLRNRLGEPEPLRWSPSPRVPG
ncbi:MAG TPA: fumarylacetoacetate hydrolase family protein [Actinomycetes bacterium]|nr:fumarylacetoacetate hydrolase family protein [Actinomycetes bacterium]